MRARRNEIKMNKAGDFWRRLTGGGGLRKRTRVILHLYEAAVFETVTQTQTELSHRQKRGFIDGIGHLSRMLFGTAMNEDVEELRDRYNHLALLASAHNKAIHFKS